MICTGKIKNARNDWLGNKGAMTAAGGEPVSPMAWIFSENRSGTNMISILLWNIYEKYMSEHDI